MKKKQRFNIFFFALFPSFFICAVLLFYNGLYYATVDDLVIQDIVRGAFTGGAWDGVFISPLLSYPLSIAYRSINNVNWLGLFYISVMFGSILASGLVFSKYCRGDFRKAVLSGLILFICWYQILWHFSFTTVAYSADIAGILMLLYTIWDKRVDSFAKRWELIAWIAAGVLLIFVGILIRSSTIISMIIILFPVVAYRLVRYREYKGMLLMLGLALLYLGISLIGNGIVSTSEIEESYERWNQARSDIGDYMSKEETLEAGIWDEDETDCFFEQIQYDKDIYNYENARAISSRYKQRSIDQKIKDALYNLRILLSDIRHPRRYENLYVVVLLAAVVYACIMLKHMDADIIMLLIGFIITLVAFAWIGRCLYRTIMPGGIFATLLVLLILLMEADGKDVHRWTLSIGMIAAVFLAFFMMVIHVPYRRDRAGQYDRANLQAIEYFAEHQNKLFLAAQSEAFGIANCVPVTDVPYNDIANLTGNWNMYSESYYDIAEHYNVDDPDHLVRSIPDSDIIRLVARKEDGVPDYFMRFISEHSGKTDVHAELEDTIYTVWMGEWGVYAIKSKND